MEKHTKFKDFKLIISICIIEMYVWLWKLYLRLLSLLVDPSNKYELSIVYKQEKYKSSILYRGWWFDGECLWGFIIVIKKEGRKRDKPSITGHENEIYHEKTRNEKPNNRKNNA